MSEDIDQRIRIAVTRLSARENGRPVTVERLARELTDVPPDELHARLDRLAQMRSLRSVEDGWLPTPPPTTYRSWEAFSSASRLHRRRE